MTQKGFLEDSGTMDNTTDIGFVEVHLFKTEWEEVFRRFVPGEEIPFVGIRTFTKRFIPLFETKYWCPWFFNYKNRQKTKEDREDILWGVTGSGTRFHIVVKKDLLIIEQGLRDSEGSCVIEIIKKFLLPNVKIIREERIVKGHAAYLKDNPREVSDLHEGFVFEKMNSPKQSKLSFYAIMKRKISEDDELPSSGDKERFILKIVDNAKFIYHEEMFKCPGRAECLAARLLSSVSEERIRILISDHSPEDSKKIFSGQGDPRVWYPGIARHCPYRPLVSRIDSIGQYDIDPEKQILFPKDSPCLYTAPEGYFIGLKENKVIPPKEYLEKYGEPYVAFPCCYIVSQYKRQRLYMSYLRCSSDENFRREVTKESEKESSRKQLLNPNQMGSISGYEPFDHLFRDRKRYFRKRVMDWDEIHPRREALESSDVAKLCYKEFFHLGYSDAAGSLMEYFKEEKLPDVRFFHPVLEESTDSRVMIFVKKENNIYFYKPREVKKKFTSYIFIVMYIHNGREIGYEVLRDLRADGSVKVLPDEISFF